MTSRGRTLCYITSSNYAQNDYQDEVPLIKSLESKGITVKRCVWTNPFDFSTCAAAIIRTPWDYHLKSEQFLTWLKDTSSKIVIHNDVDTVIQNTHKGYLKQLRDLFSIPIVPSEFVDKGADVEEVYKIIEKRGWEEAVFKPVVGASAYGLCRLKKGGKDKKMNKIVTSLLKENEGIVQPFQASVQTKGELSLMFFNNEYSHAIVKIPTRGDFRVQGGNKKAYTASPVCIDVATRALQAMTTKTLLFARIDLLFGDGDEEYLVTEVELIEPELFFRYAPASAVDKFSDAIIARMAEALPDIPAQEDKSAASTTPVDEAAEVNNKRELHAEPNTTASSKKSKKE